jgi:hypothetical protein
VIDARGPASGLTGGLHCGEKQRDQHRDDGNDYQKFDQGKPATPRRVFNFVKHETEPPCLEP